MSNKSSTVVPAWLVLLRAHTQTQHEHCYLGSQEAGCAIYVWRPLRLFHHKIHPVVEVTPFTSGTIICMGRRGGMKSRKSPLYKHTKNHWDADTDSNTYFDRIKSEYHGIRLWTQLQNIHRMPKKGWDFSQIPLGRSMHVSKVS